MYSKNILKFCVRFHEGKGMMNKKYFLFLKEILF